MGIKHSVVKASNEAGYATEWNEEHIIDSDIDFNLFSGTNVGEPINPSDIATKNYVDVQAGPAVMSPIGSMVAWLKNLVGTPALPDGWVECNGQTLSDAGSPYNGKLIPNLNGQNRFLRGSSTSGGIGGASSHRHTLDRTGSGSCDLGAPKPLKVVTSGGYIGILDVGQTGPNNLPLIKETTDYVANSPPYYDVVWIMRIK